MNHYINLPISICLVLGTVAGLLIVFVCERKKTKPRFVKVIWIMVTLTAILELTIKFVKYFGKEVNNYEYIVFQIYSLQLVF